MGHDHGHKPSIIPSPDKYKVENVPRLVALQERLAKHGLKDPWLRNEVWRYPPGASHRDTAKILMRGYKLGIPAFLLTLGVEYALGIDYGHGHAAGHDDHAHH